VATCAGGRAATGRIPRATCLAAGHTLPTA
jgi:hypothetical protein